MVKFIRLIIIGFSCFGCKSSSNLVYQDLNFEIEILKSVYFVDTVEISNAYIYEQSNDNGIIKFLTNNFDYTRHKGGFSNDIYLNPDIYLLSYCLYCHIEISESLEIYDFENCYSHIITSQNDEVTIYKFDKNKDLFIVALMNISYYNNIHSSLHGSVFVNAKNYKSTYIKVAFPYCK